MKPLSGVRIVSVEQFGAGPYATMFLADLGAEVIKVENAAIGGDPARKTGPYMLGENDSEYFQVFNINKKSVALDLRGEEGKSALAKLIASADAGATWKKFGDIRDGRYGPVFGKDDKQLFVLTGAGIGESSDGGANWSKPIPPPKGMRGVGGLTWLEYDPTGDTLYLMKMGSDLFKLARS